MPIKLIDSHCHLDDPVFDADRDARLQHARQDGVCAFLVPAIHQQQWPLQAQVIAQYPDMFGAYGLHPCSMDKHHLDQVGALEATLSVNHAVAVGEIGLDFFITPHDVEAQLALFEAQIAVARNLDLPVILHARKCHDIMLKSLRKARLKGGVVHAFSGSLQQAQTFVDLGFMIGFGGGVTYDRANKLHAILAALPLEALALETDAPDIPPSFARNVPNTPEHLRRIAEIIAGRKGVDLETLARVTTQSVSEMFGLPV